MDRVLALDYGEKRIGVALSDPLGITAQPKPHLLNTESLPEDLQRIVSDYSVTRFLVGLPKDTRGGLTQKSQEVEHFVDTVLKPLKLPVSFWDERFSTQAVTKLMIQHDVSRKKRKQHVDSQAAAFILQGYLDSLN